MANGSAHFKKGIVIQILNATGNYPVLPAQRFYPALSMENFRPGSTAIIVKALAGPKLLVEVEAIAAKVR